MTSYNNYLGLLDGSIKHFSPPHKCESLQGEMDLGSSRKMRKKSRREEREEEGRRGEEEGGYLIP